jgi:hypothetical protein
MIERNTPLLPARNSVLLEEETKKGKLHGDTERWKEKETRIEKEERKKKRKEEKMSFCHYKEADTKVGTNILTLKKSKHFRIKALFLTAQRRRHRYFF